MVTSSNKKLEFFLDFDGTIVDCMARDYKIYQDLLPDSNCLDLQDYITLRKKRTNIDYILSLTHEDYVSFKKDYITNRELLIEDKNYLSLDSIICGAYTTIEKLSKAYSCHIVSARKNVNFLIDQCDKLNITKFFSTINAVSFVERKHQTIFEIMNYSFQSFVVGDTEHDIEAAKKTNSISVAVESGMRDKEFLTNQDPDFIILNISEIFDIL